MSEQVKTPDQLLQEIADKAQVTIPAIIMLVNQKLEKDIHYQQNAQKFYKEQAKALSDSIAAIEKQNQEYKVLIENVDLEMQKDKALEVIREYRSTMKRSKPCIPVVTSPLVDANGEPLTK